MTTDNQPLIGADFRQLDAGMVLSVLALVSLGLIMVASSSMDFAAERYNEPWYFVIRQLKFLCLGLIGAFLILMVPMPIWKKYAGLILIFGLILLALVFVPGVGKTVNGSRRWLNIGPVSVQASEIIKFCLIVYIASYLARKQEEIRSGWAGFFKMILVAGLVIAFLLLEPDFGSAVVVIGMMGTMMFIAGVPLFRFLLLAMVATAGMASLAIFSPYRWERLVAFMDPWSRQFDSGYQLVQSLIAFGRGEWFGLGLGNSIQKLFFLPEAHTDFIFAIYAEEFGMLGAVFLIGLYGYFIYKVILLAKHAGKKNDLFSSYIAIGIAITVTIQVFINMGVATGLLPTKGLTLPFLSYGGSSIIITCALMALIFRIDMEVKR